MKTIIESKHLAWGIILASLLLTIAVYMPGLAGSYLFDDYPNIVDNRAVQPGDASLPSLINAALSSPSSEFKRPLASLSFAANYLISGLNPYGMKVTNLGIHLLNGLLVFLLARLILRLAPVDNFPEQQGGEIAVQRKDIQAAIVSAGWMLLPINLTAVLYVVQRMESLANLFVLLGLLGYLQGRQRMLASPREAKRGIVLCVLSVLGGTTIGLLAKETAIMLPLYAGIAEWVLFRFRRSDGKLERTVIAFYCLALLLPLCAGLTWLFPRLLQPEAWATRDFTLKTRLLSEARIVCDYVAWSLLPTPNALSFYHDQYRISQSLTTPWTTLASLVVLSTMAMAGCLLRNHQPIISLGLLWYLGAHLLTATILPLELVYEHRNYFASFGLLLALIPMLAAVGKQTGASGTSFKLPRRVLLLGLLALWCGQTFITARAWGTPLGLAVELAARAPSSPRAQYELGRTYIIYSNYDPNSPFTRLAIAPLERSAALPNSSILAEQALIFMNSRMHMPLKDAWWDSMIGKLKARRPGVQDESSLGALTQCQREGKCDLPPQLMTEAFLAALSHPSPSARLLAMYSDFAWNTLGDRTLGLQMAKEAVTNAPKETAYRITQIRMLIALGRLDEASAECNKLEQMSLGGNLDHGLQELRQMIANTQPSSPQGLNSRDTR